MDFDILICQDINKLERGCLIKNDHLLSQGGGVEHGLDDNNGLQKLISDQTNIMQYSNSINNGMFESNTKTNFSICQTTN